VRTRWRFGILIAAILALLSLYPQFSLIYQRGSDYNGAAFVNDNDESVYIAYSQSLADGRPRKNNIYSGGAEERPETFLSIQTLPAYVSAFPASVLGVTTQSFFPFLSVIGAFAAALSLFWFLRQITGNDVFSAAAALLVLMLGASAAGYGAVKHLAGLGHASAALPFLRRYTPGLAFPFLFLFMSFVWRAYCDRTRKGKGNWLFAGASFAVLLYSYFYLWTTVVAWVALVLIFTLFARVENQRAIWGFWLRLALVCSAAIIPYFWLLTQRISSTDSSQLLEATRSPVFGRPPIWIGLLLVASLLVLLRSGRVKIESREAIMIAACVLFPLVVFNQHVLTGNSLQPFHYNLYTAPYFVLIGAALLAWVCLRAAPLRPGSWMVPALLGLTVCWGVLESHFTTQYRIAANLRRDAILPVAGKLREIGLNDIQLASTQITFNSDLFQADHQPSTAPHGVLWSEHLPWGASITEADARHRYLLHLYYSNKDEAWLRRSLQNCPGSPECKAIFGARVIPTLAIGSHNPSATDIESVIAEFGQLLREIGESGPPDPLPNFAVVRMEGFDITTIDRWFEREPVAEVGEYVIYRLERKSQ
jgi:hypothetical protein